MPNNINILWISLLNFDQQALLNATEGKQCTAVLELAEYLEGTRAMEPMWNKPWYPHILTHCPALACEYLLS